MKKGNADLGKLGQGAGKLVLSLTKLKLKAENLRLRLEEGKNRGPVQVRAEDMKG